MLPITAEVQSLTTGVGGTPLPATERLVNGTTVRCGVLASTLVTPGAPPFDDAVGAASLVTVAVDRVRGVAQFDAFQPSISQHDHVPLGPGQDASLDLWIDPPGFKRAPGFSPSSQAGSRTATSSSRPRSSGTGSSFDPGSFSVNRGLTGDEDRVLLAAYDGGVVRRERLARLTLMRIACDFPEAMWGVLQQVISALDVDFQADAAEHFERLLSNATTPACERALCEAAGDRGTGDRGTGDRGSGAPPPRGRDMRAATVVRQRRHMGKNTCATVSPTSIR